MSPSQKNESPSVRLLERRTHQGSRGWEVPQVASCLIGIHSFPGQRGTLCPVSLKGTAMCSFTQAGRWRGLCHSWENALKGSAATCLHLVFFFVNRMLCFRQHCQKFNAGKYRRNKNVTKTHCCWNEVYLNLLRNSMGEFVKKKLKGISELMDLSPCCDPHVTRRQGSQEQCGEPFKMETVEVSEK